jgi:hypothetical protein
MKARSYTSVAVSAALALGIGILGSTARADETSAAAGSATQASPAPAQQRIADTTRKLEKVFSDQFAQGNIDRSALSQPISDVLEAMPEAARSKVKDHVEQVVQAGEKLSSQLTPEQRSVVVAPPDPEKVGTTQHALVTAWGWPGFAGWGGYGAFGFPGMYSLGWGAGWPGWGFGTGYGTAYGTTAAYGTYGAYGLGGLGFGGLGLGWGGWYW